MSWVLFLHLLINQVNASSEVFREAHSSGKFIPVVGTRGMVSSDDRQASEWGVKVLKKGGSAIDAAVATAFMLAVTRPHFASLGGGGFLVYCESDPSRKCHALDFRETAPQRANANQYFRDGKPTTELSQQGALASGIPGSVAGLLAAHEKFGKLPLRQLLTEPMHVAHSGYKWTTYQERAALKRWSDFNDVAKSQYGCLNDSASKEKTACPPGTLIRQPELAKVLREIELKGRDGFYKGWVAQTIVEELKKGGAVMSLEDLRDYQPKWREPLYSKHESYEIVTMPPPSSGGAILIQLLKYADLAASAGRFDNAVESAKTIHTLSHAMSLAFADRTKYFGDPDFVKVPLPTLLSDQYLKERWKETFEKSKINIPSSPGPVAEWGKEGNHTTHFSVIDKQGNAVSLTTTINESFGSGVIVKGTGILMNNEMDDFSIAAGVPNLYQLLGNSANSIAPKKRPLSSMTPTIVRDVAGNNRISIGSMGGPRIITAVFLSLFYRLYYGLPLIDAVAAPRFHHQWSPKTLELDQFGFGEETKEKLSDMGWNITESHLLCQVHGIERTLDKRVLGAADFRTEGAAVAE